MEKQLEFHELIPSEEELKALGNLVARDEKVVHIAQSLYDRIASIVDPMLRNGEGGTYREVMKIVLIATAKIGEKGGIIDLTKVE